MIITLDNLRAGLQWWSTRNWPKDIHNADYYGMYRARAKGPTDAWWDDTVKRLGQWHAYRGPKSPNTCAEIAQKGKLLLPQIAIQYEKVKLQKTTEPSIADLQWEQAAELFKLASSIKPTSPVFAGKMCHFLLPKLFIVMDNLATTVFDYEFYWRGMKDEWNRFEEKEDAKRILERSVKGTEPPHDLYPFETKIMELSHIGSKHG